MVLLVDVCLLTGFLTGVVFFKGNNLMDTGNGFIDERVYRKSQRTQWNTGNKKNRKKSLLFHLNRCQFHRLDTLLGHEPRSKQLEIGPIAMHKNYFETPVVGDMRVQ